MTAIITIIGFIGFFASIVIAGFKWEQGFIWKCVPPIWGIATGIIASIIWDLNGKIDYSFIETVLSFFAVGWGGTFCAWMAVLEGKGGKK